MSAAPVGGGEHGGVWVDDNATTCGPHGTLAYAWGCEVCGWVGVDLHSHGAAMREALRHIDTQCTGATR